MFYQVLIPQKSEGPLKYIFKKYIFKKGFYRSKLARELKFYAWIITEGSKSLKKSQKTLKKSHKFGLKSVFQKKNCLGQFEIYQ